MDGLNLGKFKNPIYPFFKRSLFSRAFIPVIKKVVVIIFPCLLISCFAFAGNETAIFFNGGCMSGESFFKYFSHPVRLPIIFLHKKTIFSDFRCESGPQFCASDSAPLEFGGSQGKKISNNYCDKGYKDSDECRKALHGIISYAVGAIIVLILTWLWFCYQDYRDYGEWNWFPF